MSQETIARILAIEDKATTIHDDAQHQAARIVEEAQKAAPATRVLMDWGNLQNNPAQGWRRSNRTSSATSSKRAVRRLWATPSTSAFRQPTRC